MSTPDIAEQFPTGGWEFTPDVVNVFDGHVRASVPHYDVIQDLVFAASDWLLPEHGTIADLGASTGTTVAGILKRHPERNLTAALYDESPEMLAKAKAKIGTNLKVSYHTDRIQDGMFSHAQADLTLSLFTLQFLTFPQRIRALKFARDKAAASGALLVAEKVRLSDPRWAEIANDLSHDWKAENGISDAAIRAKSRALRGVLRPYPSRALLDAIGEAGWCDAEVIFRWHNWTLVGAFATHEGYAAARRGGPPTA